MNRRVSISPEREQAMPARRRQNVNGHVKAHEHVVNEPERVDDHGEESRQT
jgi:hypothetical protein